MSSQLMSSPTFDSPWMMFSNDEINVSKYSGLTLEMNASLDISPVYTAK